MEPKTFRYAAVPTLPLSGGKLNTVIAIFLSATFFLRRFAHLIARVTSDSTRSGSVCDLPVVGSRPANTIGSIAPSSSGSATCSDESKFDTRSDWTRCKRHAKVSLAVMLYAKQL
jgi:hypothetical protein